MWTVGLSFQLWWKRKYLHAWCMFCSYTKLTRFGGAFSIPVTGLVREASKWVWQACVPPSPLKTEEFSPKPLIINHANISGMFIATTAPGFMIYHIAHISPNKFWICPELPSDQVGKELVGVVPTSYCWSCIVTLSGSLEAGSLCYTDTRLFGLAIPWALPMKTSRALDGWPKHAPLNLGTSLVTESTGGLLHGKRREKARECLSLPTALVTIMSLGPNAWGSSLKKANWT